MARLLERRFVAFLADFFAERRLPARFLVPFLAAFLAERRLPARFFVPFLAAFLAERRFVAFFAPFLAARLFVAFFAVLRAPPFFADLRRDDFFFGAAGAELGAIIDIMSAIIVWFSCLGFSVTVLVLPVLPQAPFASVVRSKFRVTS